MKRYLFLLSLSIIIWSCSENTTNPDATFNNNAPNPKGNGSITVTSVHVTLGVPYDSDNSDDYIITRDQYVLSYNRYKNVANWVSWELNAKWFGSVSRYSGNFITDTSLPTGFYRVTHSDYTNSGYDRGHMVMSEERTATIADNKSTFILTNILPQRPDLNQGVWLKFENYCNDLAKNHNKELFIIAGGVFRTNNKIADKVTIPDSCWKIVVVLNKGQSLNNVTTSTPVYAVMMPNISGVRYDEWDKYKTTIRKIEYSTGYNFLSSVATSIQDVIENK